uniref:Mediator of RNA polymerase II transcription subunit 15 n=1 Tax=Labrus bergylta TaxID=56723 RepID=A0A3Q3E4Y0_9LABR
MEVPGPDSDWRSPQFRQKVVAQIEEAMRKAGTAHTKSSNDMENHVYVKAKSRVSTDPLQDIFSLNKNIMKCVLFESFQ